MSMTVSDAFSKFVQEVVDLDPSKVVAARISVGNLLDNIREFDGKDGFFKLYKDVDVQFGSFARGTKCRELDDVDIMIGISANGTTYQGDAPVDDITMHVDGDESQADCVNDGTNVLNSTKVINRFVKKLELTKDYCRSELRKDHEAAVLNLLTKDWSFDIVPCFFTKPESDGRQYYLIPNGNGNWKKTDPRLDLKVLTESDILMGGTLRRLIRLIKRWNRCKTVATLQSYVLETLMLDLRISKPTSCDRVRMWYALGHVAAKIFNPILDSKGIQGDLNKLSNAHRAAIRDRALADQCIVGDALNDECAGRHETAINKWRQVFGEDFPAYG